MIQVTKTFTRPNTSVSWHDDIFAPYRDHMSNNYFKTKKIIYNESPVSEDALSRTFMQIWADRTCHAEWLNDPYYQEFFKARNTYNESVGIVIGETIITEL